MRKKFRGNPKCDPLQTALKEDFHNFFNKIDFFLKKTTKKLLLRKNKKTN